MSARLPDRVLKHILMKHPEVKPYVKRILETMKNPDLIVRGFRGEFKALKLYPDLHIGPKYLVVVYRDLCGKKVIMTAYFTSSTKRVKGEIVWRR